MSKKRFAIASSILVVILGINVSVLSVWHHEFPTIPLKIFGSGHIALNPSVKTTPIVAEGTEPIGDQVLTQLLADVSATTGWEQVSTDPTPTVPALYTRCSTQILSPAITKSLALRKTNGGVLVEVSAYPAGLGPQAFKQISSTASTCSGFWLTNDVSLGTESIAVNDNGALNNSGPSGRTIWVRSGDVIGMVSIRGGGNLSLADKIISDWIPQWSTILSTQVCPDLNNTISDLTRSPLSNNYTGLTKSEKATLTDAQFSLLQSAEVDLVKNAAQVANISDLSVPSEAYPAPKVVSLIDYPTTVIPAFPEGRPANISIVAPTFPTEPVGEKITGRFEDSVGPGCGWAFTGEQVPKAISQAEVDKTNAELLAAQNALLQAEEQYYVAKWRYGSLYSKYLSNTVLWNTWAVPANKAIVNALWLAYDSSIITYNTNEAVYTQQNATWLACVATNSLPSATPTPSPTDSPAPTDSLSPTPSASPTPIVSSTPTANNASPICGNQPIEPIKPIEPSQPRNK